METGRGTVGHFRKFLDASVIVATGSQISAEIADEAVILNTASGTYYSLEGVGSVIWSRVQKPCTIQALREHLQQTYDVSTERLTTDLSDLICELHNAGLLDVEST